jgi:hypothetical protein
VVHFSSSGVCSDRLKVILTIFVVRKMSIFDQVWFQDLFPSILSKLTNVDQTIFYFTSKNLRGYKLILCKKEEICANVALEGHLELLKWTRENGCDWDSDTCTDAALGGYLELLKWARENGCFWDSNTCAHAAKGGHLEFLKWVRVNGCPWNSYIVLSNKLYKEVIE